jgi:uncharacterized protein YkwD
MKRGWLSRWLCSSAGFLTVIAGVMFVPIVINAYASPVETQATKHQAVLAASSLHYEQQSGLPNLNTLLDQENAARTNDGQPRLRANPRLTKIAGDRAQDMVNRNYYAHKNPAGQYYYDYLPAAGFNNSNFSCENLDLQFTDSTDQFISDWLGSPAHRQCMLDARITDVGYAVVANPKLAGGQMAYIVVAIHADWSQ